MAFVGFLAFLNTVCSMIYTYKCFGVTIEHAL